MGSYLAQKHVAMPAKSGLIGTDMLLARRAVRDTSDDRPAAPFDRVESSDD
jgi:hypothetical protein